jgi:formylmethanofuran--tetrahydromethanopterin N-formyltransferase
MLLGSTLIVDTFAEAFRMRYVRLIVTATDDYWLDIALGEVTGYGSSVIGCDAEIGLEQVLAPHETPDGRPGAAVLAFGFSTQALAKAIPNRVGQCLMTCPTTAVFDGLAEGEEQIPLGKFLRYFGDGFQKSKVLGERRYWRIPVMDGEFIVEEQIGVGKGVAGGNIILQATTAEVALAAARRAVEAIGILPGAITPFPGGVVRSGSKVGSKYQGMVASTNDAFCPTLRGRVPTELVEGANCAYEIVIDGVDELAVADAMRAALHAAAGEGVLAISAGNYGGKLGKFHFSLRELLATAS